MLLGSDPTSNEWQRVHARLAKDLMHDLRGAVDDMRMRLEIGVGIDKAGQLHHPADGVERAGIRRAGPQGY